MYQLTVSRNGQITIPVEYRKKFGLDEGSRPLIIEKDGRLLIVPEEEATKKMGE